MVPPQMVDFFVAVSWEDTSHEHFDTQSKPPGAAAAGLVSRDFMSSLSAEVGHFLVSIRGSQSSSSRGELSWLSIETSDWFHVKGDPRLA